MLKKKSQPLAYCTRCGAYSRNVGQIDQKCHIIRQGKRCIGIVRSAIGSNDWQECPSCGTTGRIEGNPCGQCSGEGWLLLRRP